MTGYLEQREALLAGRAPRPAGNTATIRDLLNRFLTSKQWLLDSGEITRRSFKDYYDTCEGIAGVFGRERLVEDITTEDLESLRRELARRLGPVSLVNEVQRVRMDFNYKFDAALVDKPVRFGPNFKRPSKKVLRRARQANRARMFEAAVEGSSKRRGGAAEFGGAGFVKVSERCVAVKF